MGLLDVYDDEVNDVTQLINEFVKLGKLRDKRWSGTAPKVQNKRPTYFCKVQQFAQLPVFKADDIRVWRRTILMSIFANVQKSAPVTLCHVSETVGALGIVRLFKADVSHHRAEHVRVPSVH